MPKVNVLKKELFQFVGREFTDQEFEDFCFDFGVEIEFGTGSEMNMTRVDHTGTATDISNEVVYNIEVAANRYDLLCLEGLSASFKAYLGLAKVPIAIIKNEREVLEKIIVKPETKDVRPYVVGAILRNV